MAASIESFPTGSEPSADSVLENIAATDARLCLVGGHRIVRAALTSLLSSHGVSVTCSEDESHLADMLDDADEPLFDLIVLLLTGGAFKTFHHVQDALSATGHSLPLMVLSEQASRGQVYAALRIGAKAYVNLDAEPDELVRAVRMAIGGKVHLSPDAAQLLVDDITTAAEPTGSPRLPSVELSRREVEVVQLLCEGLSSKEVGRRLHISAKTVENHRYNIYRKCEVDGIAGLMRHAIQHGLVSI